MAEVGPALDNSGMEGMGARFRARARELGLSDAEVARRVGVGQTRYANYVKDRHEPDLATFARICAVLATPAGLLMGDGGSDDPDGDRPRARLATAIAILDQEGLAILAAVAEGLVATSAVRGMGVPGGGGPTAAGDDAEAGPDT